MQTNTFLIAGQVIEVFANPVEASGISAEMCATAGERDIRRGVVATRLAEEGLALNKPSLPGVALERTARQLRDNT